MFSKFWKKIVYSNREIILKSIQQEDRFLENCDFSDLQEKASLIKKEVEDLYLRNQNGIPEFLIEKILINFYSLSIQFIRREKKISLFPTQIIGGLVLNEGNVCQMNTGEGKTITAIIPACFNALLGLTVNVVTTNDYLAERDWKIAKPLFEFFGIESSVNLKNFSLNEKKELYEKSKVIYSTASELCFDYLKYNLISKNVEDKCAIKFDFVIIDEIDSILIDNSQNPLIISSSLSLEEESEKFRIAMSIALSLIHKKDYEVDEIEKVISLKDSGLNKVNYKFGVKNIFDFENEEINSLLFNSLKVINFYRKGVEYVVEKESGKVQLIDSSTGRISPNRVYEYGIQQLIETKENVKLSTPSVTFSKITFPNFFRKFGKISGMSGTAEFESKEFMNLYGMEVIKIPSYKKLIRKDRKDVIFFSDRERYNAVIRLVKKNLESEKRPLLIGVQNLETSEYLSKILKALKIDHYKLNATNHRKEAEIISKAGEIGSVTIATNMAGRGTDIVLSDESIKKGGLMILVLGRSEISRRLDDQFIGRGGRQGNPGDSVFYSSINDEIFKSIGLKNKDFTNLIDYMGGSKLMKSYSGKILDILISNCQSSIKMNRYSSRKNTLYYDLSLNKSRKEFYDYRDFILSLEKEKIIQFLIEDENFSLSDFSDFEPEKIYLKIKKRMIFKADSFWSSYMKISDKILKTSFLEIYLQRSPQEQFFLKINEVFKRRFNLFKLNAKNFALIELKKFLLTVKHDLKKRTANYSSKENFSNIES